MYKILTLIFISILIFKCRYAVEPDPPLESGISVPDSNSMLEHWQYNTLIQWHDIQGSNISVVIYNDDSLVSIWADSLPNTESAVIKSPVRSSWGSRNDYRILLKSDTGDSVFSAYFTIIPKQINPDYLSLPKALGLGNKFYYYYYSYNLTPDIERKFYFDEIIGEKIVNGKKYHVLKRNDTGSLKYQRVDGSRLYEKRSGTDKMIYDLAWQDTFIVAGYESRTVNNQADLFGIISKRIKITDHPFNQSSPYEDRFQAVFGQIYYSRSGMMSGFTDWQLLAIEIGGEVYDDTINPIN